MLPWAGRFGCISCLGSLGVSMGWLVYVFQWTVCVFVCSVANQYTGGNGCFNCLGGIHVYIFGSKD